MQLLTARGIALDRLSRHAEAQATYRKGLQRDPTDFALLSNLGLSLGLSGQTDEGITILRELVRDGSATANTRGNLALVYGLAGREREASAALVGRPVAGGDPEQPRPTTASSAPCSLKGKPIGNLDQPAGTARPAATAAAKPAPAQAAPTLTASTKPASATEPVALKTAPAASAAPKMPLSAVEPTAPLSIVPTPSAPVKTTPLAAVQAEAAPVAACAGADDRLQARIRWRRRGAGQDRPAPRGAGAGERHAAIDPAEVGRPRAAYFALMPMKLSMMSRIAGPISTMKSAGRMKSIIGTVIVAGRRPAFSSARIIRSVRCSWLSTLKARASGVPYFSAWIIVLTKALIEGSGARSTRFSSA